jgi:hypothetical protein
VNVGLGCEDGSKIMQQLTLQKPIVSFYVMLKCYWGLFVFFPFLNWGKVYPNLPRGVGLSFVTLFLLSN